MTQQTALTLISLAVTIIVVVGSAFFWAGQIDSRIDGIDRRIDNQDRQLEKRFDALEHQISTLDQSLDTKIEAYDYHHHTEDGDVAFTSSPRGN